MIEEAVGYLNKGFCPIPVHSRDCAQLSNKGEEQAKKPKLFTWKEYEDKLPTEPQVRAWFSPEASEVSPVAKCSCETSIALIGGHGGLAVVDIDDSSLMQTVIEEVGDDTLLVKTVRGMHLWFIESNPSKTMRNFGGIKVDIRAKGGYALVPPSPGYTFMNDSSPMHIANAESFVKKLFDLSDDSINRSQHLYLDVREGNEIGEGKRDDTLVSYAGKLRSVGTEPNQLLTLLKVVNQEQFNPPLPDEDVRRIFDSVMGYKDDTEKEVEWEVHWNDELENKEPEQVAWLVDGLIPRAATTVIAGQEGVYKTYLCMELAYCIGEGGKWLDKFDVAKGRALLIDGENGEEVIHERARQLRQSTNKKLWQVVFLMGEQLDEALADKILEHCKKYGFTAVFFDPYRLFMGGDEDKSGETATFLRLMTKFHDAGIATIIQHHHRKHQEAMGDFEPTTMSLRGSNALAAHASSVIQIAPTKEGVKVYHNKNRRGAKVTAFELVVSPGPTFTYQAGIPDAFSEQERAAKAIVDLLQEGGMFRGQVLNALKQRFSLVTLNRCLSIMGQEKALSKRRDGKAIWYYLPVNEKNHQLLADVKEVFEEPPVSMPYKD